MALEVTHPSWRNCAVALMAAMRSNLQEIQWRSFISQMGPGRTAASLPPTHPVKMQVIAAAENTPVSPSTWQVTCSCCQQQRRHPCPPQRSRLHLESSMKDKPSQIENPTKKPRNKRQKLLVLERKLLLRIRKVKKNAVRRASSWVPRSVTITDDCQSLSPWAVLCPEEGQRTLGR